MIKRCAYFSCRDKGNCGHKDCTGCGGAAYQNCGCDACLNHSFEGDAEICDVALCLREKDMEEGE